MSNPLPKAIRGPSRLERIARLIKRMLPVAAALDSAEAMTLRDKRRILSAYRENIEVSLKISEKWSKCRVEHRAPVIPLFQTAEVSVIQRRPR